MDDRNIQLIWDILRERARGIKNAITIGELSRRAGLHRRTTERRITVLRELGRPILSNCNPTLGKLGVFIARSDSQVESWERQMQGRIQKVSRHRKRVSTVFYRRTQHKLALKG